MTRLAPLAPSIGVPRLDVQMLNEGADLSGLTAAERRMLPWLEGSVYVNTGSACNQHCRYCFLDERRSAHWPEVEASVRLAARLGFHHAFLIGGEPLIYPQLNELLALLAECGMPEWGVMTNGLALAEPAHVDSLVARGARLFQVSFDSHDPAIQNDLAQNPELFDALAAAFVNLGRHDNVAVALSAVVTRRNAPGLNDTVRFVAALRESAHLHATLMLAQMKPAAYADPDLVLPLSETAAVVRSAIDTATSLGVEVRCRLVPPCLIPEHQRFATDLWTRAMTVDATGRRQVATEIATTHPPPCTACDARQRCPGVLSSYVASYGDGELRPFSTPR
jgi:organic radical activating enzyme